jgi:hypothetical protein
MKYARIVNKKIVEICVPVEGFTIEQCFHAELVAQMVACSDDVKPNWVFDGTTFTPPVEPT